MPAFKIFNFHSNLLKAIEINKFTEPTEIQKAAFPVILANRDLMACAETGSGKTVAFVLPVLQKLLDLDKASPERRRGPRVLILSPTRELATQITEAIGAMGKFTHLKWGTITGGVPYFSQIQMLRRPLDLLVATPGRLMDHMEQGRVQLADLEVFILDEADRMLDMGFVDDMVKIAEKTPATRQTLLFSATLEGKVEGIAKRFLKNPERIQLVSSKSQHGSIHQTIIFADDYNHKNHLLHNILEGAWQAIVFIATKRGADRLAEDLHIKGIPCAPFHGDMKQSKRKQTLEQLHRGRLRVLIATDVAARGIDIKKLSHVINFDLPRIAEDYVHRIGRTGRCGESGVAISLVGPEDRTQLARIEYYTGQRLERVVIPGLESRRLESKHQSKTPGRSFNNTNKKTTYKPKGKKPGFNPKFQRGSFSNAKQSSRQRAT